MESITVAAYTLGCKVNRCDTEDVLARLAEIGCAVCNFNNKADIYIINTCTVTHASDKKSKQIIRRAISRNPGAFIAVCGCMANSNPVSAKIPGVDFIFDARKPENFIQRVSMMFAGAGERDLPAPKRARTRAFVKIQDGCNRFCSYCIVPYVRGMPKSRATGNVLEEIQTLIEKGVQEIVLTGIQVASYGEDINTNFTELICRVLELNGLARLRLSSIEPRAVTNEFLSAAASRVLCDHFHLSLQSGSDSVLQRMNRRYTTAEYEKIAASLRNIRPNAALTTDVIVGFPGETDEEFNNSLSFVKKINFARVHVFEYSKREGTAAASFSNQVPENVKHERGKIMRELAAELQMNFHKKQIGKTVSVLFENSKHMGKWFGHTSNYCPVEVNCKVSLINTISQVTIIACTQDKLEGGIGSVK
jgi:threonylcarbamoyladenosine tRNA methylthiotransferase MtaB